MNIQLPDSFITPLQHIFALYDQSLANVATIHDAGVLELIMARLSEMVGRYERRNGKLTENHSDAWIRCFLHNYCLTVLHKMLQEGRLGGAALCKVSITGSGTYNVMVLGARKRNWKKKIREQNWETHRNFPIMLTTD